MGIKNISSRTRVATFPQPYDGDIGVPYTGTISQPFKNNNSDPNIQQELSSILKEEEISKKELLHVMEDLGYGIN